MTIRRFAIITLSIVSATGIAAFAQGRGGGGPRGGGGGGGPRGGGGYGGGIAVQAPRSYGISPAGFGNSLFPGGVPGHPTNLGATVRGVAPTRPYIGGGGGGRPGLGGYGRGGGRTVVVPYAVPVYGYGYGGGYGYDPYYANPPVQQMEPVPPQPPVVIVNQAYRPDTINPQFREYTNLPEPMPQEAQEEPTLKVFQHSNKIQDDKPTIFLIAMKDGNVMPALSFWVEGDTLNYITRDSDHNRISLDRVDRQFSMRLNEERGLEFRIPESRPVK